MIIFPLLLAAALAVSPTASPSVTPSLTTTSEIQKFKESISEKVKAKLQEINQPLEINPKRGYLGTITKIEENKISLDTKEKNRSISFDTSTTFINAKSTKIKSTDLKVGQEVLIIGIIDENDNLIAKRIIITSIKSSQNLKTTILGQVVDVSTMYSLIALIPQSNKNTQYQIKTDTKNIQVVSKDGVKLTLKDITKGKKVIVITTSTSPSGQNVSAEKIIVM